MSDKPNLDQQLAIMKKRLLTAGMSRRDVMKVAAAAVAGGASLAASGRAAASPLTGRRRLRYVRPQSGEEQVFYHDGIWENPVSFDWNANLYCNAEEETFAGLLTFDENLVATADWAYSWNSNEDASVWTFRIRENNKGWSDGNPVTAHDFVYSWRRQLDPATGAPYAGFLFDIKYAEAFNTQTPIDNPDDPLHGKIPTAEDVGVRAIDDWTLEVTMEGPRAFFPQVVAYQAAVPAPRWEVEKYGPEWALGTQGPIVSNGPFKVDVWEPDVKIEMSKNEGYWDAENIKLTKVITPIIPASNTVLAYESGTGDQRLDWTVLSSSDYLRYAEDAELSQQLQPYVYPGIWMLLPSNGIPPFDRLEVRKALSHAIDRERLVTVTNGLVAPAYCMVPPGVFGFLDDPTLQEIQDFDPEKALAALQGTEFEGGKNWPEITMWMRAQEENYNADIMANDIVDQLRQNLGMDVKIQTVPQANFSQQLFENKWQLVFIRWWYDYPDPNNGYGDMFYSRKSSGKRQAWSNDEFDDLVNAGKAEPDQQKRLDIYRRCEQIIQEDVGYIPLVYRLDQYVFKPWVKGMPVNQQGYVVPDGNIYVRMLTKVFVEGRQDD
ncbi:MAG TPA: peptide ABC transporter substrate-binding protein [Thermomicrobiales bacterium]